MTPTETKKKELRKLVREEKRKLLPEDIRKRSMAILKNLYQTESYQKAERVFVYVNYNQEVDTSLLIDHALEEGKTILVPKVLGECMEFYRIASREELEKGAYGILEPVLECEKDTSCQGLMILPGLVFDRNHHRIGYGGGFYDRYLMEHPDFEKVALCYDFQVVEKIETEEFDIPVDVIITETEVF